MSQKCSVYYEECHSLGMSMPSLLETPEWHNPSQSHMDFYDLSEIPIRVPPIWKDSHGEDEVIVRQSADISFLRFRNRFYETA